MATRKTNKTAHVLNLLYKGDENTENEELDESTETPDASAAPEAAVPAVDILPTGDDPLDSVISQSLEKELMQEEASTAYDEPEASPAEPDPVHTPAPESAAPVQNAEVPASESTPESAEVHPSAASTEPSPAQTAMEDRAAAGREYKYVNIMEALVLDQMDESMRQFGVCTCNRCKSDCIALSLNNLPPKYSVMKPNETSPLLNYFSNKYHAMVIAQISRACITIKEHPNHDLTN